MTENEIERRLDAYYSEATGDYQPATLCGVPLGQIIEALRAAGLEIVERPERKPMEVPR